MAETLLSPSNILLYGRVVDDLSIKPLAGAHSPFIIARAGGNRELESQLTAKEAAIARIYSFSYEGAYYDLPRPALFLVHGTGVLVTSVSPKSAAGVGAPTSAIAPGEPSLSGVAAADFQFADGIMAWSYDKADHTIRMDVETGEFEDVLLNMYFSGGKVSSWRTGSKVTGSKVSGGRLSGGRGDASD
jgi:hypothetical protein